MVLAQKGRAGKQQVQKSFTFWTCTNRDDMRWAWSRKSADHSTLFVFSRIEIVELQHVYGALRLRLVPGSVLIRRV